MSTQVGVGFTLQPDEEFLELCAPLLQEKVDYLEVTPETLWHPHTNNELRPNGFHRLALALARATGLPFVCHGVGLSMGGAGSEDRERRRAWFDRIREDHALFRFRWYTDHLGTTVLGGHALALPVALPMTVAAAGVVRRRLARLRTVVPDVGVENTAAYFLLGEPLDEPAFLNRIVKGPGTHLLLDLHNVFVMAENMGFEPEAYLERLDLSHVIEIHLSGGADSDPAWLSGADTLRLDSHDAQVPDRVWSLFERYARRCNNLRGVTLERMEGTVTAADVPLLRDELCRIRRTLDGRRGVAA